MTRTWGARSLDSLTLKVLEGILLCLFSFRWLQAFLGLCLCPPMAFPLCVFLWPLFLLKHQSLDLGPAINPRWFHFKMVNYICKDPLFKWGHILRFLVNMNFGVTLVNPLHLPKVTQLINERTGFRLRCNTFSSHMQALGNQMPALSGQPGKQSHSV